jgi:uncharacterized protein (TIGR00661 family)
VRIYGLGARPNSGRLRFFDIDPNRFVSDLAHCRGLVCTAGNQLIGEALYLQKPVLALPEPKNFEQEINGHYVAQNGIGLVADMLKVTPFDVSRFIDHVDAFRNNMDSSFANGNRLVLERLQHHLPFHALSCERIAA